MTHPATIFLVDDNEALLDALGITLLQAGYQAELYSSGRMFLDAFSSNALECQCLLMDLRMPEMDGLAVQQELLERNIRIPIIFMSGAATSRESEAAMQAGAIGFLKKPFPITTLFENIHKALERDCSGRASIAAQKEGDANESELMAITQASSLLEAGAILTLLIDVLHSDYLCNEEASIPGPFDLFRKIRRSAPRDFTDIAAYRKSRVSLQ